MHIDMGIYGAWEFSSHYDQKWETKVSNILQTTKIEHSSLNYGVRLRFGYEFMEVYAQYRISNYFKNDLQDLPKLSVGMQLMIGWY
jgi:hypothetical protein